MHLKPVIKWVGGKRWLIPTLNQIWLHHKHRRLVEPFSGGLAVSLGLNPQLALLNDINPHLINLYQQIKLGLNIKHRFKQCPEYYYRIRQKFNQNIIKGEANTQGSAEMFYYLIKTGFNGLCRFNSRGEFNVPFGKHSKINYSKNFADYQEPFAKWQFQSGDFEKINLIDSDLIYADPPYDVDFTQYHSQNFLFADQIRLANWLAKHQGPVIASNQATPRILELYQDLKFKIDIISAPRFISCNGDRTKAQEMLAWRFD